MGDKDSIEELPNGWEASSSGEDIKLIPNSHKISLLSGESELTGRIDRETFPCRSYSEGDDPIIIETCEPAIGKGYIETSANQSTIIDQ